MTTWFIGAAGNRIAASTFGPATGKPVLMLGGMGQTRHSWSRAAQAIGAQGRCAITLDLRGHGESDWAPDGDYGFAQMAGDLVAVASSLDQPSVLVGASLGGKVALAAAGHGDAHVAGLVMVDTAPMVEPGGIAEVTRFLNAPAEGFSSPQAAAEELARQNGRTVAPDAAAKMQRNMRQDRAGGWHWHWDPAIRDRKHGVRGASANGYLADAAARLTIPVLLTRGERSPVVSDASIAHFRGLTPQLQVETIPGAGHMIVGDQNDDFAAAVLRFLELNPGL